MAIYRSANGNVSTYDDDKLGFDDWIRADETRQSQWWAAAEAHQIWQAANPTAHPSTANDTANSMFNEWIAYANAVLVAE